MEAPLPRFPRRTPASSAPGTPGLPSTPPSATRPRLSARGRSAASATLLQRIRDSIHAIDALPQHPPRLRRPSVRRPPRSSSSSSLSARRPTTITPTSTRTHTRPRTREPALPSPAEPAPSRTDPPLSRWDQPSRPPDSTHAHPPPSSLPAGAHGKASVPSTPTQLAHRSTPAGSGSGSGSFSISPSLASLASTTSTAASSRGSASSPRPAGSTYGSRWTGREYCDAQYTLYRDVAHKLKKHADGIVSNARRRREQLEVAQVMWTDSLLLYAYASWARDQALRFDPPGANAASPPSERGEGQGQEPRPRPRPPLVLERSTSQRGVQDWLELQPLLEHVMKQLRQTPTARMRVLEAVLQTLQARILLLSAAYRQGSASRKLTMLAQHCDPASEPGSPMPSAEDLGGFAAEAASALKETDRSWRLENMGRAWLNPQVLQDLFPRTWALLAPVPADPRALADATLGLDPSCPPPLDSKPGLQDRASPSFPLPDGPDAPAHLVLLGRMLVAEMAQQRRIEYEPVSVRAAA